MKLAERLATVRIARGHNVRQAADEIGVSFSTYARWERGLAVPTNRWVPALAAYLSVPSGQTAQLVHASRPGAGPQENDDSTVSRVQFSRLNDRLDRLEVLLENMSELVGRLEERNTARERFFQELLDERRDIGGAIGE